MYHYVRDLEKSRYPAIKGLRTREFRAQLDVLSKNFQFVAIEDLIRSVREDVSLPSNAVHLSFDDGYRDHFDTVFPILQQKGIPGSFFPPSGAVLERKALDVNKIHFVLAAASSTERLLKEVFQCLDSYRERYTLLSNEHYFSKLAAQGQFDSREIIFIKRLLQNELELEVRQRIVNDLFIRYIPEGEDVLAEELYMTLDQIKTMHRSGMFIGSHGYQHLWLGLQAPDVQKREIDRADAFLDEVGVRSDGRVIAYPYGSYNSGLIQLLTDKGYCLGLTSEQGDAVCTKENAFLLKRRDTNEFAKT